MGNTPAINKGCVELLSPALRFLCKVETGEKNDLTPLRVAVFAASPDTRVRLEAMETQLCRSAEQFARPRPRARWGPVRMPRHHLGAASAAGRAVPGGSRAPPPPWDRGDECPPPAGNSRKTGAGVQTPGVARLGALPWRAGAGLLSRGQTGRCPRSVENKETCVQRGLLTGARPVTGSVAAQGVSQGLSRAA